jgi:hypothetical protein
MIFILLVLSILIADPAYAYVDPGSAVTISTVLGVVVSIFSAFFAVIFYPIKRVLKNWKAKKGAASEESTK